MATEVEIERRELDGTHYHWFAKLSVGRDKDGEPVWILRRSHYRLGGGAALNLVEYFHEGANAKREWALLMDTLDEVERQRDGVTMQPDGQVKMKENT